MKVALIGVDGQLGTDINSYFSKRGLEVIGLVGLKEINITHSKICGDILKKIGPDLVINTAAFHNVDLCEDEVMPAFEVNIKGVKNLAEICLELDIPLMHFSTDYVFDGLKTAPYSEKDCARPISLYGMSKLGGEKVIQYMLEKYYIVRLSGLYGHAGCTGKENVNFVEVMIKLATENDELKVINDQVLTPSSTRDVSEKLFELIQKEKFGLYHMTNTGSCSWYEFACEIFKSMKSNQKVSPITSEQFGAKAKRPKYSVLDNSNLRRIAIKDMRNWKDALKDYIENR